MRAFRRWWSRPDPRDAVVRLRRDHDQRLADADRIVLSLRRQVREARHDADHWKAMYRDLAADRINGCPNCRGGNV